MDHRALFLETLDELGRRTAPGSSEYDLVRAALLLRQLLLDETPLVDVVNRSERVDIQFTVGRSRMRDVIMADGPVFWSAQDGLDPDTGIPSTIAVPLKRTDFLREVVMYVRPHSITVREVIKYLAHVEGGAHAGVPRNDKDRALRELTQTMAIGGHPPGARSVQAIARVVLKALQPLRDRISP